MLKCKYFQIKYTEAILSNSTGKLLWFEIAKVLIAVKKNKLIVLLIIIFGTVSYHVVTYSASRMQVADQYHREGRI